jgi:hypothetical protein
MQEDERADLIRRGIFGDVTEIEQEVRAKRLADMVRAGRSIDPRSDVRDIRTAQLAIKYFQEALDNMTAGDAGKDPANQEKAKRFQAHIKNLESFLETATERMSDAVLRSGRLPVKHIDENDPTDEDDQPLTDEKLREFFRDMDSKLFKGGGK